MRFSTDGNLTLFDDFAVSPAFIYEYTKREKLLTEPPLYLIQVIQGDMTYGSANETGIFTGVNVKQNIHHQNLSMLYEVMVNNTINKMASKVPAASATNCRRPGPATGCFTVCRADSQFDGYLRRRDKEVTLLPEDSEWRVGYRMEVWF